MWKRNFDGEEIGRMVSVLFYFIFVYVFNSGWDFVYLDKVCDFFYKGSIGRL